MLVGFLTFLSSLLLGALMGVLLLLRSYIRDSNAIYKIYQEGRKNSADAVRLYQDLCAAYSRQVASLEGSLRVLEEAVQASRLIGPSSGPMGGSNDSSQLPEGGHHPSSNDSSHCAVVAASEAAPQPNDSSQFEDTQETPCLPLPEFSSPSSRAAQQHCTQVLI